MVVTQRPAAQHKLNLAESSGQAGIMLHPQIHRRAGIKPFTTLLVFLAGLLALHGLLALKVIHHDSGCIGSH